MNVVASGPWCIARALRGTPGLPGEDGRCRVCPGLTGRRRVSPGRTDDAGLPGLARTPGLPGRARTPGLSGADDDAGLPATREDVGGRGPRPTSGCGRRAGTHLVPPPDQSVHPVTARTVRSTVCPLSENSVRCIAVGRTRRTLFSV